MSIPQIVAFASLTGNISVPLFYASGLYSQFNAGRETMKEVESTFAVERAQQDDGDAPVKTVVWCLIRTGNS